MRTKIPDCPRCSEPDLFIRRQGDVFSLHCVECGWFSGLVTLATGDDLNEVIAAKVEAAREANVGDKPS